MLKARDSLLSADPRNDAIVCDNVTGERRPMRIEDLHDLVGGLMLNPAVPKDIREHFDTARSAFVYSWFDYSFVTLAEQHAYAVLEMALRDRIRAAGGRGRTRRLNSASVLHTLA